MKKRIILCFICILGVFGMAYIYSKDSSDKISLENIESINWGNLLNIISAEVNTNADNIYLDFRELDGILIDSSTCILDPMSLELYIIENDIIQTQNITLRNNASIKVEKDSSFEIEEFNLEYLIPLSEYFEIISKIPYQTFIDEYFNEERTLSLISIDVLNNTSISKYDNIVYINNNQMTKVDSSFSIDSNDLNYVVVSPLYNGVMDETQRILVIVAND